ncbi:methyltransferase [Anaerocolumna cellulosilytica]|uniref:Methyltransferase n=1 Tax=Anaerocolumna cellulosilytica TaxID=433286 RepID=A0A6S6QZX1_9FIRM|nr:methyltransferase [Anaerocolumna cellulosilytica]MBB5195240.1 SAM-dependent methyltransferase [Anaerocolumna cellulosilytica]BCJ96713.1 methyltransferase [Anaerocolumna cellulosilytica]
MEKNIIELVSQSLDIDFVDMILSNPPAGLAVTKIKVRPVMLKNILLYQVTEYRNNQVFHENCTKAELTDRLAEWINQKYKQVLLRTRTKQITALISKKGKETIKTKRLLEGSLEPELRHNREKSYIIKEGTPVPFLVDLGVMTGDGKVVKAKFDKFKQINRFLEFIEDVLPSLNTERELTILDFGCGKSYLTFAIYYYLKIIKGYPIRIIGLDLKEEVIKKCNNLAREYGYDELQFLVGDIADYKGVKKVDMVVTLHACDTATDYALYKAVLWEADVILSVPCCQHELNGTIQNPILNPLFKYGLIKERMAALATDALRGELLELMGYRSQILEFIDMEHTPKNILIRAVKSSSDNADKQRQWQAYDTCRKFLCAEPTLYKLLKERLVKEGVTK